MRIMLDTNILISMIFFPSKHTQSFRNLLAGNHRIVLCDYVIKELKLVTERKFSSKKEALDHFLFELPFDLVYTPDKIEEGKFPSVRDCKDSPILATAIMEEVDVFITGDIDFLVLAEQLDNPKIMNMTRFSELYS